MKMPKLPAGLTRFFGKAALKFKKNTPEICVVTGILMGGAAIVVTGIKTYKNKEKLQADIDKIKEEKQVLEDIRSIDPTIEQTAMISKEKVAEQKRQITASYIDMGKDVFKIYWLPGVLSVGSAGLIWGSRILFRKEIGALATLLTAATERYNKLYNRITEQYGEDGAQKLLYGIEEIEGENADGEKVTLPVAKNDILSPYAVRFDAGEFDEETGIWSWRNNSWSVDKSQNIMAIQSLQREYTDWLNIRGWITWGEIAERLGQKPKTEWYRVGWVWKKGQHNVVEFRVQDGPYQLPVNKGFMDIRNPQNWCIVDPNVDGCIDYIFDDIDRYDKRSGKYHELNS